MGVLQTDVRPGLIVRHQSKPEWGLGKIINVGDRTIHVYFRDIHGSPKDAVIALNLEHALRLLSIAEVQSDRMLDNLPPMIHGGKVVPPRTIRITEQQAVDMFVANFRSFEDSKYLDRERNYKWDAHQLVSRTLTSRAGRKLFAAPPSDEAASVLKRAIQSTNLLFTQEQIGLNDAFKNSIAATSFGRATLAFIDAGDASTFESMVGAAAALPAEPGRARVLTWPVVTLLPFLARPDRFMFLKPKISQRVAEIFLFDLLYDARPRWTTYVRLQELSRHLLNRLRPLGARDMIDVQSFMWIVVGSAEARRAKTHQEAS